MSVTAEDVSALVDRELASLTDRRVIEHVGSLLVPPEVQMRPWDYGAAGETFPCWVVFAHRSSNTGIAYCEFGFGPAQPWGLLWLEGHTNMGMDSSWYNHLLAAYFGSFAAAELAIWRVFQHRPGEYPGTPITEEDSWDATWKKVERLREQQPDQRFDCEQSVYVPT